MNRKSILNRLIAMESQTQKPNMPDLVIIHPDSDGDGWVAMELYCKKRNKGSIIPGSGYTKKVHIQNPDDYQLPTNYSGTILVEDELDE